MKIKTTFALFIFALMSSLALAEEQAKIKTAVVEAKAAKAEDFEWGKLMTYYSGESYAAVDTFTGVAIINPGMEIHPPHVHSEEEYLMVLEGEGTWTVKGKDFPAKAGDMLYAAPWDEHGLKNTGSTALSFVVVKWNSKPVSPKEKPE